MKLSHLIADLQHLLKENGDLPVFGAYDGCETSGVGIALNQPCEWPVPATQFRPATIEQLPLRVTIES